MEQGKGAGSPRLWTGGPLLRWLWGQWGTPQEQPPQNEVGEFRVNKEDVTVLIYSSIWLLRKREKLWEWVMVVKTASDIHSKFLDFKNTWHLAFLECISTVWWSIVSFLFCFVCQVQIIVLKNTQVKVEVLSCLLSLSKHEKVAFGSYKCEITLTNNGKL